MDVGSLDGRLSSLAHPDRRSTSRVPDGLLQLVVKFNKQLFWFDEIVMAQDELVAQPIGVDYRPHTADNFARYFTGKVDSICSYTSRALLPTVTLRFCVQAKLLQ